MQLKWKEGQLFWYQFVVLQLFRVDAVWVVDGSINLTNTHTLGTEPVQVPHGVKTHITKALQEVKNYKFNSIQEISIKPLNNIKKKQNNNNNIKTYFTEEELHVTIRWCHQVVDVVYNNIIIYCKVKGVHFIDAAYRRFVICCCNIMKRLERHSCLQIKKKKNKR